jgi:hypothetical protein
MRATRLTKSSTKTLGDLEMNLLALPLLFAILQDIPQTSGSTENTRLNEHLKIFEPYVGKTYRGEFANSTPDKPIVDVSRWERAMNGQAVRILHSVNQGEYGGETILMWDAKNQKIAFWYFTTAGFFTQGTIETEGNGWTTIEKVSGNANGITEVKAVSKPTTDGGFVTKSEYFKDGKWEPGNERTYRLAPDAEVTFR